ncbi:hypothetical protein FOCC_FOCC014637 [Frankliniella occidentalis]|nr:hypothetical protein FOCC_FOCC014637 [Frankliniella occidentalis]
MLDTGQFWCWTHTAMFPAAWNISQFRSFISFAAPADASAHAPTASMAPHTPATPKRAPSATPQRTPAATPTLLRTPSSTTPMRTRAATPIQIPAPSTQTMVARHKAQQAWATQAPAAPSPSPLPPPPPLEVTLDSLNVAQLKAMLKQKGLKASGKKDELKARLLNHLCT